MASVREQPSALCFSSGITDIVFGTNAEKGTLRLDIVHGAEREKVLEETMFASADGSVSVCDLSSLVEPYARQHLQVTLECSFTDDAGTASTDPVTVLFGMADVGLEPSDAGWFVENHFLTILDGEKLTALGREERLYAYGADSVTVTADVLMANGQFNTLSAGLTPFEQVSGTDIYSYDVSAENVSSLIGLVGGQLLGYWVEAGSRRQRFRCIEDRVPPAPSLFFVNSFGCYELLHCVGTHKKDSKYDRKATRIFGRLRNYRITEDRQFSANTGWLNVSMADWADDLFRSEKVMLWVNGAPGREVVISDSKSEINNEDDYMPAFEFTYTYAQRIHNVMEPKRAGRIFDNTFDHTFN